MVVTNISYDGYDGVSTLEGQDVSRSNANDTAIYDRVEIIRGATGLMKGAGNPSASINFVRKVPNATKDFTNFGLSAGSWSFKRADLDASYALNEARSIKARLNVASQKGGSYLDRYEEKKNLVYGVVDFNIGDASVLRIGADYVNSKSKAQMWGDKAYRYYVMGPSYPLLIGDLTNYPINWNYAPDWAGADTKRHSEFVKFTHIFSNDFEFNLDYSRENVNQDWDRFWAATTEKNNFFPMAEFVKSYSKLNTDSINLKLNGSYNLSKINNEFLIGLGYSKTKLAQDLYHMESGYNIPYPGFYFRNDFLAKPKYKTEPNGIDNIKVNQKFIYFSNKTDFTDKFSTILGARFTKFNEDSDSNGWIRSYSTDEKALSKYLAFTYEYIKGNVVYVSMTDIFSPQKELDENAKVLKPIVGTNYELGLKSQFFDNKLLANFAVFETRRDGVAVGTGKYRNFGDKREIYKAVDGAKNRGFELGASGKITDKLNLYVGYTYTKAKDAKDKELDTSIPDKTFKLGLDYEAISKLNLGANLRWQSDTFRINSDNNEKMNIKAYAVLDLHTTYQVSPKFKVQANINNALNKRYMTDNWGFMYKDGEPRNFMFRAEYEF